ncbi:MULTISPECIES: DUF4311 domain-containing protein [unclassified Streptomyces]|uniref:DUF4311 domain-containing protein n=1 Tax=unclassified Streptomyces TaxID=2593676 RepID=UPI002DD87166|nr:MULTISPECIES: DUF4311 domain-containing protein [unclassified Streptomyces]WSA91872.1 DUF4311 domain-containing protein [Streptomyces sp. NBC_01795]WSB76240.1 DUF4311 domain-containing protein [Streptomyces sp. NBC_01775]WSS15485.1 DUF4311 domain-containing protein [Streptomyces sp. NBC_01186]WSS44327.1 DUF4311 domain-containing protein [Streptomyces sp. NBC_01187]
MNETVTILLESIVIGALIGFGASAGVARMFHAPKVQGMGAFRTLGELNACENDPIAHFSFGFGFFFNAWASTVGAGALTGDVDHRIVPHWAAALSMAKNRNLAETLHNPRRMAFCGAGVGIVLISVLNTTAASIPHSLQKVAADVLGPASEWLINPVMPIIFWMAAVDAGRRTGGWGTVLGGLAHVVMGNAVPGIVLGIVVGKGLDDLGWTRLTRTLVGAVTALFVVSAFLRGVDLQLLEQMKVHAPHWLSQFHETTGTTPTD